jgi:hypothetical protein
MSFSKLPSEILYQIYSVYFTPVELIIWLPINKYYYELFSSIINKKIKYKLEQYSLCSDDFNTDCMLSGSATIQILLNENYKSDLDICIKDESFNITSEWYYDKDYDNDENKYDYLIKKFPDTNLGKLDRKLKHNGFLVSRKSTSYDVEVSCNNLNYFIEYCRNDDKVQLIIVDNIKMYIDSFDMDFLKNYYDGHHTHIMYLFNILNKQSDIYIDNNSMRIVKYCKRGILFKRLSDSRFKILLRDQIIRYNNLYHHLDNVTNLIDNNTLIPTMITNLNIQMTEIKEFIVYLFVYHKWK